MIRNPETPRNSEKKHIDFTDYFMNKWHDKTLDSRLLLDLDSLF